MQYNIVSTEGAKLQRLYKVEESDYPHVEIIDPRTGESLERLGGEGKELEPVYVTAYLKAFVNLNGAPDNFNAPKKVTVGILFKVFFFFNLVTYNWS